MAFSRKQVIKPQVLDLNDTVEGVEKLLRHVIGKLVRLTWEPGVDLPPVMADPGQIEQVLMNLSVNARDAMLTGGHLTIRTSAAPLPPHLTRENEPALRLYNVLSVTDTGCGMTAEVCQKIFDPFFTTKDPDKGTGLGLSTVYGIVTQSGGYISVESEVGVGSTFTVYLVPIDKEAAAATSDAPDEASPVDAKTNETVLLVEDEPAIRTLAERVLVRQGYRLLVAADGASGHRLSEEYPDVIHLLLTDIRMPGVSGPDLAQRLVMPRPEMKILFISGYAEDKLRMAVQNPRTAFLPKPFSPQQLAAMVRACLTSPGHVQNAVAR